MKSEVMYVLVTWPEIQDYMEHPDYPSEVFLGHSIVDSSKYLGEVNDVWFVPEEMYYERQSILEKRN